MFALRPLTRRRLPGLKFPPTMPKKAGEPMASSVSHPFQSHGDLAAGRSCPLAADTRSKRVRHAQRNHGRRTAQMEKIALLWLAPAHTVGSIRTTSPALGVLPTLRRSQATPLLAGPVRPYTGHLLLASMDGGQPRGTYSPRRNQPRPRYGFYVDHMVDRFGALFLMASRPVGIPCSPRWRSLC